ncbi:MAG: hypothetical protein GX448_21860 [Planctomycetes bacterium]|nr:hypothetical protein [Planctomycetota bacterium]
MMCVCPWSRKRCQIIHDISPNANHARLGSSVVADDADPTWVDLSADSR